MAEIGVPTLVIVGALDLPVKLRTAERIEGAIPGARRVVIPDAAHMVTLERPAEFQRDFEGISFEPGVVGFIVVPPHPAGKSG